MCIDITVQMYSDLYRLLSIPHIPQISYLDRLAMPLHYSTYILYIEPNTTNRLSNTYALELHTMQYVSPR